MVPMRYAPAMAEDDEDGDNDDDGGGDGKAMDGLWDWASYLLYAKVNRCKAPCANFRVYVEVADGSAISPRPPLGGRWTISRVRHCICTPRGRS
jgi:hypothetical protein